MIKQLKLEFVFQGERREILMDVVYSARRTLGLEVLGSGQVKIRVPNRTKDGVIREFAEIRKAWIVEKYLLMERRQEEREKQGVPDYVEHPELEARYREQARARISERVAWFARIMGVSYGRITIRAAKTRWGSCSAKGNLNFHWKLILMPEEVLDYVVVHELAHRKQMNHSPAFWAEVEKVLPDYRERRRWLKTWGQTV